MKRLSWLMLMFGVVSLQIGPGAFKARATEVLGAAEDPIAAAMQTFVDAGEIAGAVTLFAREGRIVRESAVGVADLATGRAMTADTMFSVASMTKPIVATAVMMLRDEGALSLDEPVHRYVPAFASAALHDGGSPNRDITIRDLLTHTSGLAGSQRVEGSLVATATALAARPLVFQPGARWQYSPGLNVAGRVVEIVTGQSIQDVLARRIFNPLGMRDTTFYPTGDQRRRMASLYARGEEEGTLAPVVNRIVNFAEVEAPSPSGGLASTARDMARFYQMILNGGEWDGRRIVSQAAVNEMTQIQTGDLETGFTPGNGWGLGWCVIREPQGVTGMLSPGTFGHGGAFGTQGWVDPVTCGIYVLMIQRSDLPNSDGSEIRKAFQATAAGMIGR